MIAMAIPILANKVEAWRGWARELSGSRRYEFEGFNDRMGLTLHRAWLAQGPSGPLVIVVCDGPGAGGFMQKLATAKEPFDRWFRARVTEFHGTDFSKPMTTPPPELALDWQSLAYAESARR
jgi:hypothetical protein